MTLAELANEFLALFTQDELRKKIALRAVEMNGCWIWGGYARESSKGCVYGVFDLSKGNLRLKVFAHRLAYYAYRGPVPPGLDLDHLCRNKLCVNPAHLEAVTRQVNLMRGDTITARNAAKTSCPSGHPYDSARRNGWRRCSICDRAAELRRVRL